MQRLSGYIPLLVVFILLSGFSEAKQEEYKLAINGETWSEKTFFNSVFTQGRSEAASFHIGKDPVQGAFLSVGPWSAGQWNARFQYKERLPVTESAVRGQYRTSDINLFEAAVFIEFYQRGRRIGKSSYVLPPALEWTHFEIPVRNPPPGTDSISLGFGLKQKTQGRVYFADLVVSRDLPNNHHHGEFPRITRVKPDKKFKDGNLFRLERDAGRTWWFVTPGGEPFYSLGIAGPEIKEPYELRRHYVRSIREMGFNSLAGWSGLKGWAGLNRILEKEGDRALPFFYTLSSGKLKGEFDYLVDSRGRSSGDGEHKFPDPFDPGFAEAYRTGVRKAAALADGGKWFIGWFADNEISHADLYTRVYSRHCNNAFLKWLRDRYVSIDALNAAWDSRYSSFDAIRSNRPDPLKHGGRMHEDYRKFEKIIVGRYIDVTTEIIRTEDPGRLVFSNRFMLSDSSEWLSLLDLYGAYDGIAINLYPSNISSGLSESEKLLLKTAYEKAGKPIIITEWSVPALDSGLYDDTDNLDWSFSSAVRTQTDRARQAAHVTLDFYNEPYIVGSHWFRWSDYYSEERMANRGIVQPDGRPWKELQEALAGVNSKLK